MYFTFDLVGILSILILSVKNRGVGVLGGGSGGAGWGAWGVRGVRLLNGQNPLRMTKVICRQSLKFFFSLSKH